MEGAADPNSKDALWSLLGRQSKVGRKLFNLYYQGSQNGNDIGNLYSERNKALYRKKLASGATPPPAGDSCAPHASKEGWTGLSC